jgi:hypothetical protein
MQTQLTNNPNNLPTSLRLLHILLCTKANLLRQQYFQIACTQQCRNHFLIHGLSKPNFFKPVCTSSQLINNFHNNPLR